jgi:hypothetical protein
MAMVDDAQRIEPVMAVVCWVDDGGREGRGSPLPFRQAVEMERLYSQRHPTWRYRVTAVDGGTESRAGALVSTSIAGESNR